MREGRKSRDALSQCPCAVRGQLRGPDVELRSPGLAAGSFAHELAQCFVSKLKFDFYDLAVSPSFSPCRDKIPGTNNIREALVLAQDMTSGGSDSPLCPQSGGRGMEVAV